MGFTPLVLPPLVQPSPAPKLITSYFCGSTILLTLCDDTSAKLEMVVLHSWGHYWYHSFLRPHHLGQAELVGLMRFATVGSTFLDSTR